MNEIINYIDSEFINYLNQISPIVKISFVLVFSLIIGSFLNVIIIRTPLESNLQEKEYVRDKYNVEITDTHHFLKNKRSACPTCSTQLKWYHNIPLFSYLALRGECHSCKTKIPYLYPITEASIAIINILVFFYVFIK